jgi:HAD superfamily hydrolase (TIGR01458 family)
MATAVLLDVDGVLALSWKPLPGAAEALDWLAEQRIPFRLVTNTSSRTRAQISELLAGAGVEVERSVILTAVSSAARYLHEHHHGAGCLVVNEGPLDEDLEGVDLVDAGHTGVVLLGGAGPSVGYSDLDAVFKLAVEGVPVVALHRNTRFQTSDGPALDMGAFIVGLEAAAGIEIPIVGKPAPEFFEAALADLGVASGEAVMVGDDIGSDVRGAQAIGVTGVLVRTGKFRRSDLDTDGPAPDHVIDDIGHLPDLLTSLAGGGLTSRDGG